MQMAGEYRLPAAKADVWTALNETEILRECLPGCESLERTSDTEMVGTLKAKAGPISAAFKGKVVLTDLDPPNGYTIVGEGSGGVAGFAKGAATVRLVADGENATVLSYTVNSQVGGKLAQIGARLIDATARQMADEFFARFAKKVTGKPPAPAAAPNGIERQPVVRAQAPIPKFGRWGLWIGLAVIAIIIIAFFILAK
jgi:carbon monoxide dehydrogenase subunit G